jgi:hypothetical protein
VLVQSFYKYIYGALEEFVDHRFSSGQPVDKLLLSEAINAYLKQLKPLPPFEIICDETNNSPETLRAGYLNFTIVLGENDPLADKIREILANPSPPSDKL